MTLIVGKIQHFQVYKVISEYVHETSVCMHI